MHYSRPVSRMIHELSSKVGEFEATAVDLRLDGSPHQQATVSRRLSDDNCWCAVLLLVLKYRHAEEGAAEAALRRGQRTAVQSG